MFVWCLMRVVYPWIILSLCRVSCGSVIWRVFSLLSTKIVKIKCYMCVAYGVSNTQMGSREKIHHSACHWFFVFVGYKLMWKKVFRIHSVPLFAHFFNLSCSKRYRRGQVIIGRGAMRCIKNQLRDRSEFSKLGCQWEMWPSNDVIVLLLISLACCGK